MKDFIEQLWFGTFAILGFYLAVFVAFHRYLKSTARFVYDVSWSSLAGPKISVEVVEGQRSGLLAGEGRTANDDPVRLSAGGGGRCQTAE